MINYPLHSILDICTINVVWSAIQRLKQRKVPGPDQITNTLIKLLPILGLNFLTNITNAIFYTLHFPTPGKIVTIRLIRKPLTENRRPISLLSCLSKIAERVVLEKFKPHFEPRIPPTQT